MIHIDSILATTDFSLAARNAAERAAMLAAAIPVRKGVLLHVLEESWPDILGQFGAYRHESNDGSPTKLCVPLTI